MNYNSQERRKFPRLKKELPLTIKTQEYDLISQTKNISCVGAYCWVDKYIAPLTKLSIMLVLPIKKRNQDCQSKVHCKGVVVRTEEDRPSGFNVAIYFNEINQQDKEKISQYINQHIS